MQGDKVAGSFAIRLVQFNILAPSARICAPLDQIPWKSRHKTVCDAILVLQPAIVSLQEFDFCPSTLGFLELYTEILGEKYELHTKQRTGKKLDGLALLLRRGEFEEVDIQRIDLEPSSCDRVCIYATMKHKSSARQIAVINTHLTVAHTSNGYDIPLNRPRQMEQVLGIAADVAPCEADLVFILGDLNCDHLESEDPGGGYHPSDLSKPVQMAFEKGFRSALHSHLLESRPISHVCSYARDGCCDYILWRGEKIDLGSSWLYPKGIPVDATWDTNKGWGEGEEAGLLSDHRPVVADFLLQSTQ